MFLGGLAFSGVRLLMGSAMLFHVMRFVLMEFFRVRFFMMR